MPRPDNSERNPRIIELANQGQSPAEIARALGVRRGVVLGVLHRARGRQDGTAASPGRRSGAGGGSGSATAVGQRRRTLPAPPDVP